MQRIVPNVWCQGTAAEAGEYYAATFPDTSWEVTASYPTEDLPDFQRSLSGQPLVVDVAIEGYQIRLINAGDELRPTPAVSFIVNVDPPSFEGGEDEARSVIHELWEALADGGEERMPLDEYPYSKLYGWVEDRYGVNWQLMLTDPNGEPRPRIVPQLFFAGDVAQAREAIDFYTGLFPDSRIGTLAPSPDDAARVLYGDFTLAGQWFSAMDAGPGHDITFTPGVSLQADCTDQTEIDRLWHALSAVPEAEQCGWLTDRFGVSWQIVPDSMADLMQHPGAYQRMLAMKKIVIDEL
ncbi:MAG TPA: VOC family protein [Microbacteriaceae bacterium]|nr:VOC family protein [Microbacteriaceae bacterium]